MPSSESITSPSPNRTHTTGVPRRRWSLRGALLGGGIDGNEELTSITGLILIVLLAALGITILRIGQLIWLHLFLGLLLLGPVLVKIASTGYRFMRYYTRAAIYVAKGPPMLALRAMGPFLVLTTVVVFASGIVLLFDGPASRATPLLIHKASFILWGALFGLHVLVHLPGFPASLRAVKVGAEHSGASLEGTGSGAAGRWIAIAAGLVLGLVVAIVLIPDFGIWTAAGAIPHHDG